MITNKVKCTNCGKPYPDVGTPYRCEKCGGIFDFEYPLKFDAHQLEEDQPGIWRYRHTFMFENDMENISLGEGNTPLLWTEAFGQVVALKCESLNPTGSFKDRGSSLISSFLISRGVKECIEDSSGNAGASLAAYTARAGIQLNVFAPAQLSGIKQKQIEAYGAKFSPIHGSRSEVSEITKQIADSGKAYASHAYLPINLPGYATIAYEIFFQLGKRSPGAVIVPVGQGGLLLGLFHGFEALRAVGLLEKIPVLVGVQVRNCAPLWSIYNGGMVGLSFATDQPTLAEGIRIWHPIRGDSILSAVRSSNGKFIAVDEEDILIGLNELADRGFHIEPTSAVVWSALGQCVEDLEDPIILILTGSGLKQRTRA
jgi:threonine synthase